MNLKRIQSASQLISYVAHPLLMPVWVVILAVYANPYIFDIADKAALIGLMLKVFTNFVFYPALAYFLMLRLKLISSLQLESSKDRILPFIAAGLFYIWGYEVLRKAGVPLFITKPLLGAVIGLFAAFFINIFTKISLHALGIAGLVTTAIILNTTSVYSLMPIVSIGILIAGLIGTARYIVHAHSLQQILLGTFIGSLAQIIGFYI